MNFLAKEIFWIAVGSIGSIITSIAAILAYKTYKRDKDLSRVRLENAIELNIGPDGAYTVINNSDEAIMIYQINQTLITGTELGIQPNATSQQINKGIGKINEISFQQKQFKRERWIMPTRSFVFGDSSTHLPKGYEKEAIWIVISEIYYESKDMNKFMYKVCHRFSKNLEPRLAWIEFTNWVVGETIPI